MLSISLYLFQEHSPQVHEYLMSISLMNVTTAIDGVLKTVQGPNIKLTI